MRVIIGNLVYDTDVTPVVLAFANDDERKQVASHLTQMAPKDDVRMYGTFPETIPPGYAKAALNNIYEHLTNGKKLEETLWFGNKNSQN